MRKKFDYLMDLINQKKLVIGENGRVYKVDVNGELFPGEYLTGYGYYQVSVYIGNYKYLHCLSHRLIYAYHHGIDALNPKMVIHHLDFDKTNNHISNLVQITKQENSILGDGTNNNYVNYYDFKKNKIN